MSYNQLREVGSDYASIHRNICRTSPAMKNILVPTDFSQRSKASFKFAIDLASKAGADVHVVHMLQLPFLPETTFGIQPYRLDPDVLHNSLIAANKLADQMRIQFPTRV